MNCDAYLQILSTASLGELDAQGARQHRERCANCDRVTRAVVERERERAFSFERMQSHAPARYTSDAALVASRERRFNWLSRLGIAVSLFGLVGFALTSAGVQGFVASPDPSEMVEEAILLRCLSAEQAAELARPLLRDDNASIMFSRRGTSVMTVRATREQVQRVYAMLDRYEGSPGSPTCATPADVAPVTPPP